MLHRTLLTSGIVTINVILYPIQAKLPNTSDIGTLAQVDTGRTVGITQSTMGCLVSNPDRTFFSSTIQHHFITQLLYILSYCSLELVSSSVLSDLCNARHDFC